MTSKFIDKYAQKISILLSKASYARSLIKKSSSNFNDFVNLLRKIRELVGLSRKIYRGAAKYAEEAQRSFAIKEEKIQTQHKKITGSSKNLPEAKS